MSIPRLTLRPKREGRVSRGHPWIFSNELEPGFADLPPGAVVDVFAARGAFVGRGLLSPNSLITVRLMSRARHDDLDSPLFYAMRLREALAYRQAVHPERQSCRLVHAEGDFLPGLIVDRFGDHLAVQVNTVGLEQRLDVLRTAIEEVLAPAGAVFRNDNRVRELEGLEQGRSVWFGDVPEHVDIDEYGVTFRVPLLGGQKTGHFFDQAFNRLAAGRLAADRTVLDVYANTGGFGLQCLAHGAREVLFVEKSEPTAEACGLNAEINDVADRATVVATEATKFLEHLVAQGERFDLVCIDPPAFAKSKKTAGAALRGYARVNALAMTLVRPGGFLITSSCSHHVHEDRFLEALTKASTMAERPIRLVRRGEQAPDHPVLPAVPETRYLKHVVAQVLL
jgi:23S rRNA (cytosine1962-C5)-methyltransferase